MDNEILGRDEELARIDAFVALGGPRALLIEGEAGIGKTTLWRRGIDLAGERSSRVLSAAPAASEAQLAYSALRDLLGNLFVEVEAELQTPQRRALAVALLIEEPRGRPPGQEAVAAGALAALRAAARASPVLVAIDDVQWLDGSSALVLGFAARRLGDERVALLLARRAEPPGGLPLELDRASIPMQQLPVGPLSVGALNRLIQRRLDRTFPRPILLRLHEMSAGNPFFGLELARALEPAAVIGPGEPLPVPPSLRELVEGRLAALAPQSAEPLLAAAALAVPTLTLVRAVSPDAPSALRAAIEAGVIEL